MADNQSLEEVLLGIQLQQVSAMYDDRTGSVYVVSDATQITPELQASYASAYMGGLQQALFDVAAIRDTAGEDNMDRFRAVSGLISGDVALVSTWYGERNLSNNSTAPEKAPESAPNSLFDQAPDIVRKTVLFPVLECQWFVEELYFEDNSWQAVDRAYGEPPGSTEQVLHFEKYLAAEPPVRVPLPDFTGLMSGGWTVTATDTMGEFLLRSYLEEHLSEEQAEKAAGGWGGDSYVLLSDPEQGRMLVARVFFDTSRDAEEFYDAFKSLWMLPLKARKQNTSNWAVHSTVGKLKVVRPCFSVRNRPTSRPI